MNRIMSLTLNRVAVRSLLLAACIISLAMQPFAASPAIVAATTLPVLWTAGGLSAGNDSAGQAARMTTDVSGNVAIVLGTGPGAQPGLSLHIPQRGRRGGNKPSALFPELLSETGWLQLQTAISWPLGPTLTPMATASASP